MSSNNLRNNELEFTPTFETHLNKMIVTSYFGGLQSVLNVELNNVRLPCKNSQSHY